jgi:hypothetical protein
MRVVVVVDRDRLIASIVETFRRSLLNFPVNPGLTHSFQQLSCDEPGIVLNGEGHGGSGAAERESTVPDSAQLCALTPRRARRRLKSLAAFLTRAVCAVVQSLTSCGLGAPAC